MRVEVFFNDKEEKQVIETIIKEMEKIEMYPSLLEKRVRLCIFSKDFIEEVSTAVKNKIQEEKG